MVGMGAGVEGLLSKCVAHTNKIDNAVSDTESAGRLNAPAQLNNLGSKLLRNQEIVALGLRL